MYSAFGWLPDLKVRGRCHGGGPGVCWSDLALREFDTRRDAYLGIEAERGGL